MFHLILHFIYLEVVFQVLMCVRGCRRNSQEISQCLNNAAVAERKRKAVGVSERARVCIRLGCAYLRDAC